MLDQSDTKQSSPRAADKKLILSFLRHIKAKELSIGRQAKYAFMLKRCALLMRVPFRKARRGDYEDLITRLADFTFVRKKYGEPPHYNPPPPWQTSG